jgi:hypothetical protein
VKFLFAYARFSRSAYLIPFQSPSSHHASSLVTSSSQFLKALEAILLSSFKIQELLVLVYNSGGIRSLLEVICWNLLHSMGKGRLATWPFHCWHWCCFLPIEDVSNSIYFQTALLVALELEKPTILADTLFLLFVYATLARSFSFSYKSSNIVGNCILCFYKEVQILGSYNTKWEL